MCSILVYLHSQSPPVLHRDFTPDNLILGEDGTIVLIDFNVAEQREGFETSTVVGKHSYIPPEQFRGKATTQSDIYSMGCVIYFLLTGNDPEPISISHPKIQVEHLSENIDDFVAKATNPDSNQRFLSIDEMLNSDLFLDKPA